MHSYITEKRTQFFEAARLEEEPITMHFTKMEILQVVEDCLKEVVRDGLAH